MNCTVKLHFAVMPPSFLTACIHTNAKKLQNWNSFQLLTKQFCFCFFRYFKAFLFTSFCSLPTSVYSTVNCVTNPRDEKTTHPFCGTEWSKNQREHFLYSLPHSCAGQHMLWPSTPPSPNIVHSSFQEVTSSMFGTEWYLCYVLFRVTDWVTQPFWILSI